MKKIVFTTFGSLGDLHPVMAIAIELKNKGHVPVIGTSEFYREYIESSGIDFHPIRPHINHKDPAIIKAVLDTRNGPEILHKKYLFPYLQESLDDLNEVAKDADLIIGSVLTYYTPISAHLNKIPWLNMIVAPISMWSGYDPPILAPLPFLGKMRFLPPSWHHWILKQLFRVSKSWAKPLEKLRKENGMSNEHNPFSGGLYQGAKTVCLWSKNFYPKQIDWPENAETTGFVFFDPKSGEPLDQSIIDFRKRHKTVAVFTLGSTTILDAEDLLKIFFSCANELDMGCIITCGDKANEYEHLNSDKILVVKYAPYSNLFPIADIIVHQGGVGTTSQCLKAGKPQIVIPFCMDQFDNGYRIQRLGCGKVIEKKHLKTKNLVSTIKEAMVDQHILKNCQDMHQSLEQENGIGNAADEILSCLTESQ